MEQLFFRHIPRWLTVDNRHVLHEYYTGQEDFFTARNMGAWILPALAWTGFLVVFLFNILCINIIVRKQWTEHERLSFPIIRLPLELVSNRKFFSKKLMWIGFGAALTIELFAGLDYLYPIVPSPRIKMNVRQYFVTNRGMPWEIFTLTSTLLSWACLFHSPFAVVFPLVLPSLLETTADCL